MSKLIMAKRKNVIIAKSPDNYMALNTSAYHPQDNLISNSIISALSLENWKFIDFTSFMFGRLSIAF